MTEYDLPDGTGVDLVSRVRNAAPDTGCILHTATDRDEVVAETPDGVVVEYADKAAPKAGARLARIVRTTATFRTQTSYPLPEDESERLGSLDDYDLEDDALRADLDRVTDLAASHFDASTASINVIHEHEQDFLTCRGADWSPTAREDSICTYTIVNDDDVTVIEDVDTDPRFEGNDTLRELGIRSYMGADLRTPTGSAIGTLCVHHDEPRGFDADDEAFLRTLADVAMNIFELHHRAGERADAPAAGVGGDSA